MNKIKLFIYLLILLSTNNLVKAQYGCFTPSLGVYDGNTFAPLLATIPCTYTNLIAITPVSAFSGNNGTMPCMQIKFSTTNANSVTNNSLTMYQGTTAVTSLCSSFPAPCYTAIPASSNYSFSLAGLNPTQSHSYSLCNTAIAGSFNYTVSSCYSNVVLASGAWSNAAPNSCIPVNIPANSAIGNIAFTITPSVPATASITSPGGYLYLDTYQMTAGTYTITYFFNSQNVCTATSTRTIQITNPYNANWTAIAQKCPGNACLNLNPQIVGTPSGTFTGTGVSSNSFCPSVAGAGIFPVTYTVGITPQCGSSSAINLTVNPTPTVSAGPSKSITCTNATTVLVGSGGGSYNWSGPPGGILSGGATSNPNVVLAGTYSLVVTSAAPASCQSSLTTVAVSVNTLAPTATTLSPNLLTCSTLTTNAAVTATAGMNYSWTGPSIVSGATTSNPIVNQGGNYNATITNTATGCFTTAVVAVSQNTAVINSPSTTGTVTCANTLINLTSPAAGGNTYTWTAPAGSSISSGTNSASASGIGLGTYTLFVLNTINGCSSTSVVTANVNQTIITPTISAPSVLNCTNTSVTLNGTPASGVTYTWSTGGNASSTAILAPGVITLSVTNNDNGCIGTKTVNVTQNITQPTITAIGSQTANSGCGTSSLVTLSGTATPSGSTYTWTSSGGFASGVNNSTVIVNGSTTYTLNSTHPVTGCISSLVYTVNPSANQPTLTVSSVSGTVTCANTIQSTTVTSNPAAGVSYSWSGPGIVGASNAAAVSGSLAGVYTLTVTNTSNNCNSTASYILSANNTAITPNASTSNSVNCNVTTATITTAPTPTSASFTYSWSTTATSSSVSVNPTVNTNYVVTVTNTANGCTGSQTINVVANTIAPTAVIIIPNNVVLACPAQTANLVGSATGATSYTWIAPAGGNILGGANTATAQVTSSSIGTFSLIAIGANGCSAAAAMATVSPNTNAPTFTLSNSNPSITCLTSSPIVTVGLTSTVSILSYSWSPSAGISGPTNTSVVTFTTSGIYTGVIIATNGCISTTTVSVASATTAPSLVAGTGTAQTISCSNTIVTIAPTFTPSANLTYTWSGPGVVGSSNNSTVQVNQNGQYSLTVTNTLTGCSSTSITVDVFGTNVAPSLNLTSSSAIGISCQPNTSTVTLTAASSGAVTYSWSTGATASATPSSTITTSSAGIYTITVVDINSNCSSTQTIVVANNTVVPSFTASSAGNLPCGTAGTTTLNAIVSNTNVSYNWSGPSITTGSNTANPEVNGAGVYTVIVTDNITGCVSTQTVSISSTSVVASFNENVTTGPIPLTVNFNNTSIGATTYSWSFGNGTSTQINPTNVFATVGTYTVVLTSINGACTATADVIIKVTEGIGTVPEVFTPNGDGHNDAFEIKGLDAYPNNSLQIFNRWGNPVYFAKPYKNDWDGTPNTAGKTGSSKLPTATYFYILDLGDENKTIFRGFIQLQY